MRRALHVLGASGGEGWTPADLSDLFAWFDADNSGSIVQSGGRVSRWDDLSGNGRNVGQADGAYQPYTGARTIGGRNALDFRVVSGNAGSGLLLTGLTITSPVTVGVVMLNDAIRSDGSVAVSLRAAGGYAPAALSTPDPDHWWIKGTTNIQGAGVTPPATGSAFTAITVLNGASSLLRVNGVQQLSGNGGTTSGDRIGFSCFGTNSYQYGIDGAIGEVVIALGALSGADLTSLESYLKAKWGTP
jgi:hypothetical protein